MAKEKKAANGVEWRMNMADGSSKVLVQEAANGLASSRAWHLGLINGLVLKVWNFLKKAKDIGVNDPRKVIHGLKVGLALTVVLLFYYTRPLYEGVGGNAMWAIMTVVVAFENTVGATIYKCLNRVCGTSLAGLLAFGVHWVASKSGEKFEPYIVGASVFFLGSAATFSRFIPSVKQRFDYGAMIFVLTFSLVAVSGYRIEKLLELAHQRISTIIIGISLCIFVSMLVCPMWAGRELHTLVSTNMDKLANSLDGCVDEYFDHKEELVDNEKKNDKKLLDYKCVLSSKATEESLANFARWEPAHGCFGFKHPWKQYLKIGASMRSSAYCIEALSSCVDSENQAPEFMRKQVRNICLKVRSNSSIVIRELAEAIRTMKQPSNLDFLVEEMESAVDELQDALKSLCHILNPSESESNRGDTKAAAMDTFPFLEVIPLVTFASLLMEIAARIKNIVKAVEELAELAEFKVSVKEAELNNKVPEDQLKDKETMKVLQSV